MAGTLSMVFEDTEVAWRYQVDWSANRAKFGKRSASSPPSTVISEASGNSSIERTTTGAGWLTTPGSTSTSASANSRSPVSEKAKKATRKRSGPAAR
jgi:hypothetical protein